MWATSEFWRHGSTSATSRITRGGRTCTQRAHAEGPDVLAYRRAIGGEHHVAAGNPAVENVTGTIARLDPRLDVRAVGPVHIGPGSRGDDFSRSSPTVSGANNGERHPLQVMYAVGGNAPSPKRSCITCPDMTMARPCGSAMAPTTSSRRRLGFRGWTRVLTRQVPRADPGDACAGAEANRSRRPSSTWREPDRGIWEVRGEPQHFTSSKIMCWVALDRGPSWPSYMAGRVTPRSGAPIAEEIKADILANGVDSRGVLTQRYGDDALDASLLLAVLTRFPAGRRPAATGHGAGHRRRA